MKRKKYEPIAKNKSKNSWVSFFVAQMMPSDGGSPQESCSFRLSRESDSSAQEIQDSPMAIWVEIQKSGEKPQNGW